MGKNSIEKGSRDHWTITPDRIDAVKKALEEDRVLLENNSFVVIAPYASEFPYQLMILPRTHQFCFEEITDEELVLLSGVFKKIFHKYKVLLGNIPFNYFFNITFHLLFVAQYASQPDHSS